MHTIYRIVCFQNGMVYVGQTNNFERRKREHKQELKGQYHNNIRMQNAYDKYGAQSFYWEILEKDLSKNQVDEREAYWIKYFDTRNKGFNMVDAAPSFTPGNAKPCEWNGIKYKTIREAAQAIGISERIMALRFKKWGYKCDADMPGSGGSMSVPCEWNGVVYPSVTAAARANGFSNSQMYTRLNKYEPGQNVPPGNFHACEWDGVQYKSKTEAAKANGITISSMAVRIRKGYKCDEDMIRQFKPRH